MSVAFDLSRTQFGGSQHGGELCQACGTVGLRETPLPQSALRKAQNI